MAIIQYSEVIRVDFSLRSPKQKDTSSVTKWIRRALIFSLFVLHYSCHSPPDAVTESSLLETSNEDKEHVVSPEPAEDVNHIINPLK
jgi:hypothetical protein